MRYRSADDMVREKWRELGFFCDIDDGARRWRLVGAKGGLQRFAELLRGYASDPVHALLSEHDHFGPYFFKIMTWTEPGIDEKSIHGTVDDLHRLAAIVEDALASATPGNVIDVTARYVTGCRYSLDLDMRADGFDPASEDSKLG